MHAGNIHMSIFHFWFNSFSINSIKEGLRSSIIKETILAAKLLRRNIYVRIFIQRHPFNHEDEES